MTTVSKAIGCDRDQRRRSRAPVAHEELPVRCRGDYEVRRRRHECDDVAVGAVGGLRVGALPATDPASITSHHIITARMKMAGPTQASPFISWGPPPTTVTSTIARKTAAINKCHGN